VDGGEEGTVGRLVLGPGIAGVMSIWKGGGKGKWVVRTTSGTSITAYAD
jgi:hypothetical protein